VVRPSQTLFWDTSFVSHLQRRMRDPLRYEHWDVETVGRLEAAPLAISVVTIAETRVGYRLAGWGPARIESAERDLRRYLSIPVGCAYANVWARLRAAARTDGIGLSDNDLSIVPCGGVGQRRKDAGKRGEASALQCVTRAERPRTPRGAPTPPQVSPCGRRRPGRRWA
jgi:predicted nucleic acid-binding protein